jgi:hypothetical protein
MANLGSTFYDRERTLVNLSNSILKAYGVATFYPSIPAVDAALSGHARSPSSFLMGRGRAS